MIAPQRSRNDDEALAGVQKCLGKITPETCRKLVDSMPNRIVAVLKSKGGYTSRDIKTLLQSKLTAFLSSLMLFSTFTRLTALVAVSIGQNLPCFMMLFDYIK